jgi:hypothetical protein
MNLNPVAYRDADSLLSRLAASYGEFKLVPRTDGYWLKTTSFSGKFLVHITFSVGNRQFGQVMECFKGILISSRQV